MELSLANYIYFIDLQNSLWGFVALSILFIVIAQIRPFMAIALICFFPTIPWSASWKPFVTLYPIYPLLFFLYIKYSMQIIRALFNHRYRVVILLSSLIVLWSFLSPALYEASYGPPISFSQNQNYNRGFLWFAVLLLLPAMLQSREDIRRFLLSTAQIIIAIHLLVVVAAVFFLMSGHSLSDLHLMKMLDTPPVYWESGILILLLAYLFILRKSSTFFLVVLGIIACAGLILGNSRTRFLATFICLLYFLYPYISRRLIASMVTVVLLFAVSPVLLPNNVKDYFSQLINQRIEQSSSKDLKTLTTGRIVAYEFAYKRWKQSPLIGVGSCYILPRDNIVNLASSKAMPRVHNYFLEVLAGQGLFGFSLLVIVLGITTIMVMRIAMISADKALDGRIIVTLFLFGIINWMFKESWGITYCAIAILTAYTDTRIDALSEPVVS